MDISIQLVYLKETIDNFRYLHYGNCDLIEKKEYVNLLVHAEETNIMIGDCKCACTEYVKYQHQNSKI